MAAGSCTSLSSGPKPASFAWQRIYPEEKMMKRLLARLWKEEEGQDLTEYALLLVLLSLAAIGSISGLATAINGTFSSAASNVTT